MNDKPHVSYDIHMFLRSRIINPLPFSFFLPSAIYDGLYCTICYVHRHMYNDRHVYIYKVHDNAHFISDKSLRHML